MLESVYIYPNVLGHPEAGLVVEPDGFSWSTRRPRGSWSLRGSLPEADDLSLDELLRLEGATARVTPDCVFLRSLTGLPEGTAPPWSQLLKRGDYLTFLKNLAADVRGFQPTVGLKYYNDVWRAERAVFSSLERFAAPDPALLDEATTEATSFKPRGGACDRIVYNRFGTRTGRLTISGGPRILTLKRELRRHLRSRWPGGELRSIDFSALEVRLLIAEGATHVPTDDPYLDLAGAVGGLTRSESKIALLSTVYGATEHGLSGSLHTTLEAARKIKETISTRYGSGDLVTRLRGEFMGSGSIRNRFGRRVEVPDPSDGSLLNSYLQSTGADVSLLGFKEIIGRLPEGAVPVAVLHDALIIDCSPDFLQRLGDSMSVPVPSYSGRFPMKISTFNG